MSDKTLGISVKATADFSDVTRAGEKAAAELRNKLGGGSGGPKFGTQSYSVMAPFLGKQIGQPDPLKAVDSLQKALDRAHQSGKRLRDIKFPSAQFGEAAKQVQALERRIALMHMTPWGKDLKGRLAGAGADLGRPLDWDWRKLYGSQSAGEAARQKFYGGAFAQQPPARAIAPVVVAGSGGGGETGMLAGVGKLARLVPAIAAAATVAKGIQMMNRGYEDHLKVIENVDAMYKGMSSERGFKGLTEDARTLGNALLLTSAEASKVARDFVSASGAMDSGALGRAGAAGQFGRGYGMDPSASAGLFARAGLVGVGNNRASQRDFARTLAETIGGSGMFTRADQVMGDLVERIEKVATSQGRTSGAGEHGAFSAMLQGLYANPAMRGGGAQSVLSSLDAAGGRGGEMQEMFAWLAFGDAAGMDAAKVRLLQESGSETSPYDLFGDGFTKETRAELVHDKLKRLSHMSPGATERERYAYTSSEYGYGSSQIALQQYDLMEGLRASGGTYSGFASWLPSATGRALGDIAPAGYNNLSRLYGKRGDRSGDHVAWMRSIAEQYRDGGNVPGALGGALSDALAAGGDPDKLEALLPKIVAAADAIGTAQDKELSAKARLATEFESLASAMHPVNLAMKEVAINGASAANALKELALSTGKGSSFGGAVGGYFESGSLIPGGGIGSFLGFSPLLKGAMDWFGGRKSGQAVGEQLLGAVVPAAGASVTAPPRIAPQKPTVQVGPAAAAMSGSGAYPYSAEIKAAARKHGVPEWALAGIISQESNFGKDMVGDNGASVGFGHFNINGALKDYNLTREELLAKSPAEQIDLVADFLAKKVKQEKGDIDRGIQRYNGGGDPNYLDNVRRRARKAGFGANGAVSPAAELSGLGIQYAGDDSAPYGVSATRNAKPFDSIIYHHAEGDIDNLVAYGKRVDSARGGSFGYHYYIGKDGKIIQGAPLDKRTNHIKPNAKYGTSNASALGITLVDAVGGATDAQMQSAQQLGARLRDQFGIDPNRIWGHGEIQGDKMATEGKEAAERLRAMPSGPDLGQAPPKMPPALYGAIAPNSPNQPNDARWQGQVAMDVTFRTDRGAILQRRHSLAVSEPRVAGSGGSAGDSSRFSWNDSVTLPAIG